MSAIKTNEPVSYNNKPTIVMVYELPIPVESNKETEQQVDTLFTSARLSEFNQSAVHFMGAANAEDICGTTIAEQLQKSLSVNSSDSLQPCKSTVIAGQIKAQLEQFVNNGYLSEQHPVLWAPEKNSEGYDVSYCGLVDHYRLTHMVVIYKVDETGHQIPLVSTIVQGLTEGVGTESFFMHLVRHLTCAFDLDYAAIGETIPGSDGTVKLLSFHNRCREELVYPERECCLKDTPGYGMLQGDSSIYPQGVATRFAETPYLNELNVDAFIGVPVTGNNALPVGAIWLMHRCEIADSDLLRTVLTIFALRVAAEIARERREKEHNLREQQQLAFIKNNASAMFVVDVYPPMDTSLPLHRQVQWLAQHTRFVDCNDAALSLFGYRDKTSLPGRPLLAEPVCYDFATLAREFVDEGYQFCDRTIQLYTKDGAPMWVSLTNASVIDQGKLVQLLGVLTDVTERVLHSKEMEFRAKHDSLTGLPNRGYFIEQVEQALTQNRCGGRHALFILDLDGFKEINDTLGHEIGDCLLEQVGPRARPVFNNDDIIFSRLGGDEFAAFIPDYKHQESIIALAGALMQAIKSPFVINELELTVGGSIGIALYPRDGETASSLMRCADVAMYQAKQRGMDFCLYNCAQDHYTVRRLSLMMDIRQAIENNELDLHYQPIINLLSRQVQGFEVLIRWRHPQHGVLSPAEFVPLVELTDMIQPMTWWVVETAIKQLSDWDKRNWPYRIAVNISTRNLIDESFVGFIKSCLKKYQVKGDCLELEITESTLMADPEKARRVLQLLAELGTSISIDDYGTGYSSLAYLKSLPITTLKIDRTFISQMSGSTQDKIIVNSTIQLAHNLGLDVVAEGIEDITLIEALNELGCDKGQGYYICRPVPLTELENWLNQRTCQTLSY